MKHAYLFGPFLLFFLLDFGGLPFLRKSILQCVCGRRRLGLCVPLHLLCFRFLQHKIERTAYMYIVPHVPASTSRYTSAFIQVHPQHTFSCSSSFPAFVLRPFSFVESSLFLPRMTGRPSLVSCIRARILFTCCIVSTQISKEKVYRHVAIRGRKRNNIVLVLT